MRYTVRTSSGGELQFDGIEQLRESFRLGLVDPDDEVREEQSERWVKANAIPVLAIASRAKRAESQQRRSQNIALVVLVVCQIAAFVTLFTDYWPYGLALAIASAFMLMRFVKRHAFPITIR